MNRCPFRTKVYSYDPHSKVEWDKPLHDIGYNDIQCVLPYGHVGEHVCRNGTDTMSFPNSDVPTEQGILLEWHRRKEMGESTEDLERVLGLSDRFKRVADMLGVTGKAAHRAIARELTKRSATTDEERKKRLIKI